MSVCTTGALLQASDDTVTCIAFASLYFHTPALHRSFLRSAVGCSRIKPSAFSSQSCDYSSFFPLLLPSWKAGDSTARAGGRGGPSLLIPYRPWMQRARSPLPSPPLTDWLHFSFPPLTSNISGCFLARCHSIFQPILSPSPWRGL